MERIVLDFLSLLEYHQEVTVADFLYSLLQVFIGFGVFLMLCKMIFALIKTVVDWHTYR